MVKIRWTEQLEKSTPQGEFELRFCDEGRRYMKYIMTFILWIEKTVCGNIYYNIVHEGGDFRISCNFSCDEHDLKRVHNRFRTLVRKYYRIKSE